MTKPDNDYLDWLIEHSMLQNAKELAVKYGGQGRMWRQPYAEARPRAASATRLGLVHSLSRRDCHGTGSRS